MTLLAWPAVFLLLTAGVLTALASWRQRPVRREVGTLLIWQRVAQAHTSAKQRRRSVDYLYWILLLSVVVGAFAATRPALVKAESQSRVAVFIEATGPDGEQADLNGVKTRAEAAAPEAAFTYFLPARVENTPFEYEVLDSTKPIRAQIAAFAARSSGFDARLLLLNEQTPGTLGIGRVLPRVLTTRAGVVFGVSGGRDEILVQSTKGAAPSVSDSELVSVSDAGRFLSPQAAQIQIRDVAYTRTYTRRKFAVGTGDSWRTDAHLALLDALETDSADGTPPDVWLGAEQNQPAIRFGLGESVDIRGAELSFDPQHPLFQNLPLGDFPWLQEGKVLASADDAQPLLVSLVDGQPVGDLVRLRDGGRVLEFAGDPFTGAPIASAALLLDNAVGVVTGVRPSAHVGFVLTEGPELPTRRQATATDFEPVGALDLSTRTSSPIELSSWLFLTAGLLLLLAAVVATRGKNNSRANPGVVVLAASL